MQRLTPANPGAGFGQEQATELCQCAKVPVQFGLLLLPTKPEVLAPLANCGPGGGRASGGYSVTRLRPVFLSLAPLPRPLSSPPVQPIRFWIDEVLWSQGRVAVELFEEAAEAEGWIRTGGPGRQQLMTADSARVPDNVLGFSHTHDWELLWTKSTYAFKAARTLRPGQLVSAIVGLNALTMKKRMLLTLKQAYGQDAFQLTPMSFALPEELPQWQAWLHANKHKDPGLWILKTGQDAGKGLKVLPTIQALAAASQPLQPSKHKLQLQVAQQYIQRPLLLDGRKFHLRLWLLVTRRSPLTAYLHRHGLVLFASAPYEPTSVMTTTGNLTQGHITNYARNQDGTVWSLEQFELKIGRSAFQQLWHRICQSVARALAACLDSLGKAHEWLQPSIAEYGFQMLGVDYLLDESWHPWLLEFNSAPSIMALHDEPESRRLIYQQKYVMLQDMLTLVKHRLWRTDKATPEHQTVASTNTTGFVPVMHLFPPSCASTPWTSAEQGCEP